MNLEFFRKKDFIWLISVVVLFVILRISGVHSPYHQDEYKWAFIVDESVDYSLTSVPHPPVGEFAYKYGGLIVGYENLRFVPFVFGLANLFLIFYLAKIIFDRRTSLWITGLFTVSYLSILASLMVDTDGAIMPFFLLIVSVGYMKLKAENFAFVGKNWKWFAMLILGAVGGFLVKVSFAVALVAFVLDFIIEKQIFSDKKKLFKFLGWGAGVALVLVLFLFAASAIFPYFDLSSSFKYWMHFLADFSSRGWLQTFIQFTKSLLYASPLLILPILFVDREIFKKARPFFLFISLGLIFYLVVFDFSIGALDRYLQFLVIPLCIICGGILSKHFHSVVGMTNKRNYFYILAIGVAVFVLQFFNHFVPSLYPKTEWLNRTASFRWDFLFPFMGGSGPVPFYVSFLFIALIWTISLILVVAVFWKRDLKKMALAAILILGLVYNGVFIEEYLFGKINGSAPSLIKETAVFIKTNPDIEKVTVYNDNGGYDIQKIGKYRKRLYVDPSFDINVKMQTLNKYKEHYMVIDIPHLDPDSIYQKYFDSCRVVYKKSSGKISSTVYDCSNAPDITNN